MKKTSGTPLFMGVPVVFIWDEAQILIHFYLCSMLFEYCFAQNYDVIIIFLCTFAA